MESNLLKEAIADAKAVRQTALANAKVALEEAFNEKYHAMFAEKLKEDAAMNDGTNDDLPPPPKEFGNEKGGGVCDEKVSGNEIDELIKELEAEVDPNGEAKPDTDDIPGVPGAKGIPGVPGVPGAPALDGALGAVPPTAGTPLPGGPAPGAATPGCMCPTCTGLAAGGLGGAEAPPAMPGAPAIPPVQGDFPPTPPSSEVPPSGEEEETDEDVNLDELLETLREEVEEEGKEGKEEDTDEVKKLDEEKKLASSAIGGSENKKPSPSANNSSKLESGGIKQEGMPHPDTKVGPEDATTAKRPNQAKNATKTNLSTPSFGGTSGPLLKATRPNCTGEFENTAKLNEAYEVIRYVKGQLNEVNLLNGKLLYTNKLFKEYNMDNSQKMRIVEMFDLARSVREVKLTYANIAESLNFSGNTIKKKTIKGSSNVQSITEGLASQAIGSTKPSKEILSEGKVSDMVTRFQKIAGIKKPSK